MADYMEIEDDAPRDKKKKNKKGDVCFRCNQPGHFARDCELNPDRPAPGGGGKPKREKQQYQDYNDDAPPTNEYRNDERRAETYGTGTGDRACFRCGMTGHVARTCPQGYKYSKENSEGNITHGALFSAHIKPVSADTRSYFQQIHSIMQENAFEDDDDRRSFLENVYKETKGSEIVLVTDPEVSKIIETLINISPPHMIRKFLYGFKGQFLQLSTDRRSSHVLERILGKIPAWSPEFVETDAAAGDEEEDESAQPIPAMRDVVAALVKEVTPSIADLIRNAAGSHVVRALIFAMAGIERSEPPKALQGKRPLPTEAQPPLVRHGGVMEEELRATIDAVDAAFPLLELPNLCVHAYASPVLQCIFETLQPTPEACDAFICRALVMDEGADASITEAHVSGLLQHDIGSHLMEKAAECASPALQERIVNEFFVGRVLAHAKDRRANFVLQRVLTVISAKKACLAIVSELLEHVGSLLTSSTGGVVVAIAQACARMRVAQRKLITALSTHLSADDAPAALITGLLEPGGMGHGGNLSTVGALIVQAMLGFDEDKSEPVYKAMEAVSAAFTQRMARDPAGSRVIERFMSSGEAGAVVAAHVASRQVVIDHLLGSFGTLAADKFGSRAVEAAFNAANVDRKQKIASELVAAEEALKDSTYGRFALRNCRIDHFKRSRETWQSDRAANARKMEVFADILNKKGKKRAHDDAEAAPAAPPVVDELLANPRKLKMRKLAAGEAVEPEEEEQPKKKKRKTESVEVKPSSKAKVELKKPEKKFSFN